MIQLITTSELEKLTDAELLIKFNEVWYAMSQMPPLSQDYQLMQSALEKIQSELYSRKRKLFKPGFKF